MTDNGEFKALVRKRMEITGESYTQAMRHVLEAARTAVPNSEMDADPPSQPTVQHRVSRPWDRPESEFPALVPIDTLQFAPSGQAAIAITGILAYTTGFEIFMTRCIRPGVLDVDEDSRRERLRHRGPDKLYALSLLLSDGTKVVRSGAHEDSRPTGPILRLYGGGGAPHSQFLRWWAWPLPPKGPLEFICQWQMLGIAETQVSIDAQLIIDAAQRSVRLWPDDEG